MLIQDLKFAVRSFLRSPRFTVPAVVALALGIGATSAIFSIVRGVILGVMPPHFTVEGLPAAFLIPYGVTVE